MPTFGSRTTATTRGLSKSDVVAMTESVAKAVGLNPADAIAMVDATDMLLNGNPVGSDPSGPMEPILIYRFGIYRG